MFMEFLVELLGMVELMALGQGSVGLFIFRSVLLFVYCTHLAVI